MVPTFSVGFDSECKIMANYLFILLLILNGSPWIAADSPLNAESPACDCNPTGSVSNKCAEYGGFCLCKNNVVGRKCDQCAPGTYGFGPEGCKACDCHSIGSKDATCDQVTGQCDCVPNAYGRICDECLPGFGTSPTAACASATDMHRPATQERENAILARTLQLARTATAALQDTMEILTWAVTSVAAPADAQTRFPQDTRIRTAAAWIRAPMI